MAISTNRKQLELDKFVDDGSGNPAVRAALLGGTISGDLTITGDLTVGGDFDFGDAATDTLTVAGYIQGSAAGKTFVSIGDATSVAALVATDDLVVAGKVEFQDTLYSDRIDGGTHASFANQQGSGGSSWLISRDGASDLNWGVNSGANRKITYDNTGAADLLAVYGSGSTSHSITDGVVVSGSLETDGDFFADGNAYFAFNTWIGATNGVDYGGLTKGTDDGLKLSIGSTDGLGNHHFIMTSGANVTKDHDHDTMSTNPTIFVHSATDPDTDNTQWGSLLHDQTDFVLATGKGVIKLDDSVEISGILTMENASTIKFSAATSDYGAIRPYSDGGTHFAIGSDDNQGNRSLVFVDAVSIEKNYGHSTLQANPTLFGHSVKDADDSDSEYWSMTHDGDDKVMSVGLGGYSWDTDAQPARGSITFTGLPVADETMVLNGTTITAKADGSGDVDHFTIGGDAAETATNLAATINEGSESANAHAYIDTPGTVIVEWLTKGVAGNTIVWTDALTNAAVDGTGTLGATHTGVAAATLATLSEIKSFVSQGAVGSTTTITAGNGNYSVGSGKQLIGTSKDASDGSAESFLWNSFIDLTTAGDKHTVWNNNTTSEIASLNYLGELTLQDGLIVSGRTQENQGADVASANDVTLGGDGNVFEITGAVQINRITNTGWQNGSEITLLFTGAPTVKHGQASGGAAITILLAGSGDLVAAANGVLKLVLAEIGGVQAWREVSRTVA